MDNTTPSSAIWQNGPLLALTTAFIFATSTIAAKIATLEIEAFAIILVRSGIALVCIAIIAGPARAKILRIDAKDIPALFILGAAGIVGCLWFLLKALEFTTATNTALIGSTAPVATAVMAAIVLKERLKPSTYAGVAVSFLGILLLISQGDVSVLLGLQMNKGDLLMFGNVAGSVTYALMVKKLSDKYPAVTVTFYMTLAAIVLLLFFVGNEGIRSVGNASLTGLLSLVYLGVVTSAIGYLLYNYTVKIVGPTIMSCTVFSAMPVFVMILAAIMLGEPITGIAVASAALISFGLYLTLKKPAE